jgi:uncharacterized protein YqgC (DUF456 family)
VTAVDVIVWFLMLVGLAGCLLPFVPGPPLIVVGALVHAIATGFDPIGVGRLAILALLAVAAFLIGHAGGALGARRYGGSRWAVAGAIIGVVVGLFFGLPGLVLGPPIGATVGELLRGQRLDASVRSGLGAVAGMVAGALANFTLGLIMVGLFGWWIW